MQWFRGRSLSKIHSQVLMQMRNFRRPLADGNS